MYFEKFAFILSKRDSFRIIYGGGMTSLDITAASGGKIFFIRLRTSVEITATGNACVCVNKISKCDLIKKLVTVLSFVFYFFNFESTLTKRVLFQILSN